MARHGHSPILGADKENSQKAMLARKANDLVVGHSVIDGIGVGNVPLANALIATIVPGPQVLAITIAGSASQA